MTEPQHLVARDRVAPDRAALRPALRIFEMTFDQTRGDEPMVRPKRQVDIDQCVGGREPLPGRQPTAKAVDDPLIALEQLGMALEVYLARQLAAAWAELDDVWRIEAQAGCLRQPSGQRGFAAAGIAEHCDLSHGRSRRDSLGAVSIRKLAALAQQRRHDGSLLAALAQAGDHAGPIDFRAVLADLPLAFDPRDRNLDADDALDLRSEILLRCVIDLPRFRQHAFLEIREILELAPEPAQVFDHARRAPGVHRHVVPGRHDIAVLLLGRIPGRRDVLLRSLEYDQALVDRGKLAPLRIAAGHVGPQRAGGWQKQGET